MKFIQSIFKARRKSGWFSLSRNSVIFGRAKIHSFVLLTNVYLGDMSYVANFSRITNCSIGKFTSIGSNVKIGLGKHPSDWVSSHPAFYSKGMQAQESFVENARYVESEQVVIGNDVWIGCNVLIMDGVTIGDGAFIGAGAVVTCDVPPFAVAVGIPAKVIKYRFSDEDINFLQLLRWWDKSDQWFKEYAVDFNDIEILKASCSKKEVFE